MNSRSDGQVLTVSPEMVALNPSDDSDWARAVLSLVRDAAAQGNPVDVSAREVTYSPAEVGRMVDVSKATVLRRIADGTIQATKHGSNYRIARSEVYRYSRFLMDQLAEIVADEFDL
jgi:excisionase family DNA binding protein